MEIIKAATMHEAPCTLQLDGHMARVRHGACDGSDAGWTGSRLISRHWHRRAVLDEAPEQAPAIGVR